NRAGYDGASMFATANDQIFVGNTVTGTEGVKVETGSGRGALRVRNIDSHIIGRATLSDPVIELPPTPPNKRRKIFEVDPAGSDDAAAIQAQIDAAAMEAAGSRPVVHLPKGDYQLARTVVVPAGKDLQLIGDGDGDNATVLSGNGIDGPVLRLEGPS